MPRKPAAKSSAKASAKKKQTILPVVPPIATMFLKKELEPVTADTLWRDRNDPSAAYQNTWTALSMQRDFNEINYISQGRELPYDPLFSPSEQLFLLKQPEFQAKDEPKSPGIGEVIGSAIMMTDTDNDVGSTGETDEGLTPTSEIAQKEMFFDSPLSCNWEVNSPVTPAIASPCLAPPPVLQPIVINGDFHDIDITGCTGNDIIENIDGLFIPSKNRQIKLEPGSSRIYALPQQLPLPQLLHHDYYTGAVSGMPSPQPQRSVHQKPTLIAQNRIYALPQQLPLPQLLHNDYYTGAVSGNPSPQPLRTVHQKPTLIAQNSPNGVPRMHPSPHLPALLNSPAFSISPLASPSANYMRMNDAPPLLSPAFPPNCMQQYDMIHMDYRSESDGDILELLSPSSSATPLSSPSSHKSHGAVCMMWEFIANIVLNPAKKGLVVWTGNGYQFRIVKPKLLCAAWSKHQGRNDAISWANLKRTIRLSYNNGKNRGMIENDKESKKDCTWTFVKELPRELLIRKEILEDYIYAHNENGPLTINTPLHKSLHPHVPHVFYSMKSCLDSFGEPFIYCESLRDRMKQPPHVLTPQYQNMRAFGVAPHGCHPHHQGVMAYPGQYSQSSPNESYGQSIPGPIFPFPNMTMYQQPILNMPTRFQPY